MGGASPDYRLPTKCRAQAFRGVVEIGEKLIELLDQTLLQEPFKTRPLYLHKMRGSR